VIVLQMPLTVHVLLHVLSYVTLLQVCWMRSRHIRSVLLSDPHPASHDR
jgi:hypothetical protein